MTMQARDYQTAGIRDVEAAWLRARRVLYALPTGGGKTVVGVLVVLAHLRAGGRALWLAHRRELVKQAVKALVAAGVPSDQIGVMLADDPRANPLAMVQVGSVDSIRRRDLPDASLVVIDEAHHAPAETWRALVGAYPGAKVLGLSATPYRAGREQLGEHFDELVLGPRPSELIAGGWLVAPKVYAPDGTLLPDLTGVRVTAGDFHLGDLSKAARKREIVGGIVDHWLRLAEGRRTVAYAVDVAHARAITARFRKAGVAAETLTGETPTAERDAMLERLTEGTTRVVTNCQVLTEGWDAPPVKCAILAAPTRSLGKYVQMGGRILRPWEGVQPLVLDHAGNAGWLNVPHFDHPLSLAMTQPRRGRGVGTVLVRSESGELVERSGELVEVAGAREPDRCSRCLVELSMRRGSPQARRKVQAKNGKPFMCLLCSRAPAGPKARSMADIMSDACASCSGPLSMGRHSVYLRRYRHGQHRCKPCTLRANGAFYGGRLPTRAHGRRRSAAADEPRTPATASL